MPDRDKTTAIVGGAIIGSFCAFFLRKLGFRGRILVFERDTTYQYSSTALCAASIRTQFSCEFNTKMSLFGAQMFRNIGDWFGSTANIAFEERGYLIVHEHHDGRHIAAEQMRLGCDVSALNPEQLQLRYPWINSSDVTSGTFGNRNEGWYDAWSLLQLVRDTAKEMGAEYIRAEVAHINVSDSAATGVILTDGSCVSADYVINAAGPLSANVLDGLGIELPVVPKKRTVFNVETPLPNDDFPMLFDSSGVWIRPEGKGFITGIAPEPAKDPNAEGDFEPDYYLFEEEIWPRLAHRVPAMESLRMTGAWAGHYEVNELDHNGIVGPHNEIANLIFATGFSGHGLMHAPAVGRGVAELICMGEFGALDLSALSYSRILERAPIEEMFVY